MQRRGLLDHLAFAFEARVLFSVRALQHSISGKNDIEGLELLHFLSPSCTVEHVNFQPFSVGFNFILPLNDCDRRRHDQVRLAVIAHKQCKRLDRLPHA